MRQALAGKKHAVERLLAYMSVFQHLLEDAGDCPVLNTAIEAGDAHPALGDRARNAMNIWRASIQRIVAQGIECQEIRPDVDIEAFTTIFIATLEGAVMLSKLYENDIHMRYAIEHLTVYIETTLKM